MAAIKLSKFLGLAPKISPELLPESVAQVAFHCQLQSGDLVPYFKNKLLSTLPKTGVVKSIYPLESGGTLYWLHWNNDVDVAKTINSGILDQRIYYTGDSEPRVTNFTLATTSGSNYPVDWYTLGLPAPTVAPSASLGGGGSGTALPRTYVYTWLTLWGEESQPSAASNSVNAMEGQTVTVTLTTSAPAGDLQTTGMVKRLYRSVSSTAGTFYYFVADVAMATSSYNDTTATSALVTTLPSTTWASPSSSMIGMITMPNGMMVGFFDNTLCFCEPYFPHAWPVSYRISLDHTIIAISSIGNSVICATTANPYVVTGNSPSNMSTTKLDVNYPCVSKRSMANMGWCVVYASRGGLVVISQSGNELLTKHIYYWDSWQDLPITTIVAKYYDGKYYASYTNGSFIFERDDQIGGYLVTTDDIFTAAHYDFDDAIFYFLKNEEIGNRLYQWSDKTLAYDLQDWKSKVYIFKEPINIGAARVVFDDTGQVNVGATNAIIIAANAAAIAAGTTDGAFNDIEINGSRMSINGSGAAIQDLVSADQGDYILFQLFANKILVHTQYVLDTKVFRTPPGIKSDTWEVKVSSTVRIRAIHLAETPLGLKQA